MTLLNPAYGIILPFLFICTLPLAIFATFTTFLAFSILLFRVVLVYIELGLAVIPYYLLGLKTTPRSSLPRAKSFTSPGTVPGVRRRKRRSSTSSNLSGGTITPVPGDTGLGLSQSIGPTRDFEGVGGWRIGDPSDDDELWTNINTRLELPAYHERRHHRRSLTSGSMPGEGKKDYREGSPEAVMNISRARTPPSYGTGTMFAGGYFPQVPTSPRLKRSASGITGTSNSSSSSKGSSVLGMKQR